MRLLRTFLGSSILPLVGLGLGFIVWEIISRMGLSPAFPPLTDVLAACLEVWKSERFLGNLQDSLLSVVISLPPALILGILLVLLVGRYRMAEWALNVYINTFLSIPLVALIPVLVLIFGLGRGSILATIVIYTVFVVIVNTSSGVKTTDASLVEIARSFGASEPRIVRRIVLPAALPLDPRRSSNCDGARHQRCDHRGTGHRSHWFGGHDSALGRSIPGGGALCDDPCRRSARASKHGVGAVGRASRNAVNASTG